MNTNETVFYEGDFKKKFSLEKRKDESSKIISKYADRVPIIIEKSRTAQSTKYDIKKHKYLVPSNFTMGEFMHTVRKRLLLAPELAIFVYINGSICSAGSVLSQLYKEHKDPDGFLYLVYSEETTFG